MRQLNLNQPSRAPKTASRSTKGTETRAKSLVRTSTQAGKNPAASTTRGKNKYPDSPNYRSGLSPINGRGVFATKNIKRGEYIGEYLGPEAKKNGKYVLWVEDEVGRSGRNALRFLNHSCRPNAEFDGFHLYAIRKILEGEEITFDYGDTSFDFYYADAPNRN